MFLTTVKKKDLIRFKKNLKIFFKNNLDNVDCKGKHTKAWGLGGLSLVAANLNPNDTFLAKYEINSIKTNRGNNVKGQPAGTNKEKNPNPCFWKPNKVAPKTIVKLIENVKIKWDVEAKL